MKLPSLLPMKMIAGLLTNKYFLIFIAILSSINIVGYLTMGYLDAVILFALVAFLTFVFSKNMTVVLLVATIVVNLFMHQDLYIFEGMETDKESSKGGSAAALMGGSFGDPSSVISALTNMEDTTESDHEGDEEKEEKEEDGEKEGITNRNKKEGITNRNKKEGITNRNKKEGIENKEPFEPAENKQSSHINYATTLGDAYKNLDQMMDSGGLKNLTTDTKKLIEQQSKLFNSMELMVPLLARAQNLMKGVDVTQLTGRSSNLADSAETIGRSSA